MKKLLQQLQKLGIIMIVMGFVYLTIEIFDRWIGGDMIGFIPPEYKNPQSFLSLTGFTSLWMFPIGALCGSVCGAINETRLNKLPMLVQCFIGVIFILLIELISGYYLNVVLGLSIWDYSMNSFNIMGQICLRNGFLFLLITPFAFWLDDIIRYNLFDEDTKYPIWRPYYRAIEPFIKLIKRIKAKKSEKSA